MFNNGGYSLSDIAAVSDRNDDGWGGNGCWWIILLFLVCGWGNNGWGNGNGNGSTTREEIAYGFDMNQLSNGVRGVQQGICDSTYALNNAITNGNAGLTNTMTQGFAGLNSVINDVNNAQTIANLQSTNALQAQLAQCCCEERAALQDVKYTMATDTCAINTNNSNNTRDIIDSQNANTRAILEAINQGKIDAMQDKIACLAAENQKLAFEASQRSQNSYLLGRLQPVPVPSYTVPSPFYTPTTTTPAATA